MPYKPSVLYWQNLLGLLKATFSFNVRPALGAAGLLLLATSLLLVVVGSIKPDVLFFMAPKATEAKQQLVESDNITAAATLPVTVSGIQADTGQETSLDSVQASTQAFTPIWPITGKIVKNVGWYENQTLREWRYHAGCDIEGEKGQEVSAMLDGEVLDVYNTASSGLTVVIKHGEYMVQYGSLNKALVQKGEVVKKASTIGTVGSFTAEPYDHLHLVIKQGNTILVPQEFLK